MNRYYNLSASIIINLTQQFQFIDYEDPYDNKIY